VFCNTFALAFAGFCVHLYENAIHSRRSSRHLWREYPEVIFFYNMSALAFAGFGWLAYENATH
jgi:hypothetical protein